MIPSLYTIKAILIMDNDGHRLVSKYFNNIGQLEATKDQKDFEKNLFSKTHKANGEIIMLDNLTVVYRSYNDLFFYIVGSTSENEIILVSVLNCLFDSLTQVFRKNVEKKFLLENMSSVFLTIDEICDNGILMETDPSQVANRVAFREAEIPLGEQTVFDVMRMARDQLKGSVFK
jgi:hypothetical protein